MKRKIRKRKIRLAIKHFKLYVKGNTIWEIKKQSEIFLGKVDNLINWEKPQKTKVIFYYWKKLLLETNKHLQERLNSKKQQK